MSTWTLQHGDTTQSLAEWGMTGVSITERALTTGLLTARIPGDMLASVPWEYKDSVILRRDSTIIFRGTALSPRHAGAGTREGVDITFADPWWWLSQASYSQAVWDSDTSAARQASMVALFATITEGVSWSPASVGAQIAAIIAHCNTLHGGGRMHLGTLSGDGFSMTPVAQRVTNVTHEGALIRCLAWVPDAIPTWDHTTDPPTLNIAQRASATVRTYSFADASTVMEQEMQRRPETEVTGVRIVYQALNSLGDGVSLVDAAGESSGSGVVDAVVDLTGGAGGAAPTANVTPDVTQSYDLITEPINHADRAWWFKHGDTGAQSEADIAVKPWADAGLHLDDDAPENAGKGAVTGSRQWLSGGIPEGLADTHTCVARVQGCLLVRTNTTDPDDAALGMEKHEMRTVRVTCAVTSLTGGSALLIKEGTVTMGGGVGGALGTFVPTGVAAQLLAAWSAAQYDGVLRIVKTECNEPVRLGDVVNLTDGKEEWEVMKALVTGLRRDIDSGSTTITLGTTKHLSLNEHVSQLKVMTIAPALDLDRMSSGSAPSFTGDPVTLEIQKLVYPRGPSVTVLKKEVKTRIYTPTWEFLQELTDDA